MKISQNFKSKRRSLLQSLAAFPLLLGGSALAKAAGLRQRHPGGSTRLFGENSENSADQDSGGNSDGGSPLDENASGVRVARVLQNWTDESTAIVTILGEPGWTFEPAAGSNLQISEVQSTLLSDGSRALYKILICNLNLVTLEQFLILDRGGAVIDSRSLKGLDLSALNPKIVVASCANYRDLKHQAQIYRQIPLQQPDVIFFIGDIVYSDSHLNAPLHRAEPPESATGRYIETWDKLDMYQLDPLVPLLSTWDDHDYGQNNGDSSNPYRFMMKSVFRSFYPMPISHPRLSFGPGVSFRLRAFGIDFHFLDDRSFAVTDVSLWGAEQEAWLTNDYNSSENPAWILNGTIYFKYYTLNESVEKKALPSLNMLKALMNGHRKPTVLLSGDIHASQVQQFHPSVFGYRTFEITSSAVHSSSAHGWLKRSEKDGQIFYYGYENFVCLQTSCSPGQMDLQGVCATADDVRPLPAMSVRV